MTDEDWLTLAADGVITDEDWIALSADGVVEDDDWLALVPDGVVTDEESLRLSSAVVACPSDEALKTGNVRDLAGCR